MTALEIARRRLRHSGLTETPFETPVDVVRHLGAMQAQDYGPAKWSIAQRATTLVDDDLERAVADGSILRTHVLRPTWHFVAREDIRWLLALTGPRVQQQNGPRYRELELDERILARCRSAIESALDGENHLTRDEIAAILDRAGIDVSGQRLPYVLMHCELEGVIGSGGRAGKKHTYALLDERVPKASPFDRDGALVELMRRYLTSHGPATVKDLRWWSSLTIADIKQALDMLGSEVENESIEGLTLWSIAGGRGGSPRDAGAHLLQTYDELIVGYTESRFIGDPRADATTAAWRARTLPTGIVVVDARIAGHWRRTVGKKVVTVEVLTYEDPKPKTTRALEAAAGELGRFLGREALLEAGRL